MADIEKRAAPAPDSEISPDNGNGDSTEIPSKAKFADIGYGLFQQAQQYDAAQLEIDSVKVRRKLDFIVLPMMMTTYMLNVALQRFPVGKMIGCMLFAWGSICMLQAAVFNFSGFFAIRFSLGFVEACISSAWILLTSMLWTREEQSTESLHFPCLMIQVVGAITIAWGFVIILYLPDGPHNAKCLTEYGRIVAVWRVSKNQTGVKDPKIMPHQIKEALLDSKTYILLLMAACYGILNGGVANFISLLHTPGGAFEIVMCIAFGYLSTYNNSLGLTIILGCIPGIAGLVGLLKIPIAHRYALVGCCWLQKTLPAVKVACHTERSTVLGLYFIVFPLFISSNMINSTFKLTTSSFYCGGNIAGPHIFIPSQAPRYFGAIKGLLVAYCIAAGLQVAYTAVCYMENKKRDKAGLVADAEVEALEGFGDLTDK
ncbi:MFS transporter [Rhexocercosporidium sp. MPI-PUGE-AT-0058]|nr:MFS transporter [Rhexocercosporidium sp. MPI-PUGE-AT-0058]